MIAGAGELHRRYIEVGGPALASALTLSAFISVIPLIVVSISVLGFVAAEQTDLADRIIEQLDVSGVAAEIIENAVEQAANSARAASLIGLLTLAFTGLGLARNMQVAHCRVWQMERRGGRAFLGAVVWVAVVGLVFLAGFAITAVLQALATEFRPLVTLAAVLVGVLVFLSTIVLVPNKAVRWSDLLPGAIVGAALLEVLKVVGAVYLPRAMLNSSGLYGPIGVVIALLSWLLVFGRLVLYVMVFHVLRWEHRHGTALRRVAVPMPVPAGADITRGALVAAARPERRRIRFGRFRRRHAEPAADR